jgi:hypothetical protein
LTHPLDLIANLDDQLISNQISAYQKLQEQLERRADRDSQLLEELADLRHILAAADQAAQESHIYQKASDLFLRAFRLDPHNQNLYRLAGLMQELARATRDDPEAWQASCDRLAGQVDYNFKAARYYLDKARGRVGQDIRRVIQLIRTGLLDASRDKLQEIAQTWGQLPSSIQCLQHICYGYWHLYDYAKLDTGVEKRLSEAKKALGQAQAAYSNSHELLHDELKILETLVQLYDALYQTTAYEFEPFKNQLQALPGQDDHVFVKRLAKELRSLDNWKRHHEQVFNDCLNHQYGQAARYLQQLTDLDKEAVKWLNPTITPDLGKWENFSHNAQHGLECWQTHQYAQAQTHFSMALEAMPIYVDGQVPEILREEFTAIVQDLNILQESLAESLSLLGQATDFERYKRLPENLGLAWQVEEKYQPIFGGEAYLAEIVRQADKFVGYAQRGEVGELQNLVARSQAVTDPLAPGYKRITRLISKGKQPDASLEDVETALKLAPGCTELKQHREAIIELIQTTARLLEDIQNGRFDQAWDKLEQWDQEHAASPPPINCLWHLCKGYDCLVGSSGQALLAKERLAQATQFAEEANRACKNRRSAALTQELATLNTLVEIYRHLNQQGLIYLQTAKTTLNRLQNKANVPTNHVPIRIFSAKLANLDRWRSHREHLFNLLTEHQYTQALEYLRQISEEEKSTFEWLDAAVSPSWEAWETFCLDVQRGFTLWQAYTYREAWTQLAYASKKIPADLPQVQAQVLQAQVEETVRNLVTIETAFDENRAHLEQAVEVQIFAQISDSLEQLKKIEARYFQQVSAPITSIINRYDQFKEAAQQGDELRLQDLIIQATKANDPLAPGYEHLKAVIGRGKKADASREDVQVAWKLAPASEELAKKIDQFEIDEIIERVLKNIRGGRLERAGRLLDTFKQDQSRSLPFQCLLDIYNGYQHLYGHLDSSQTVKDRIGLARQTINMAKNCPGPELAQERDTLKALVRAYASFQAGKWRDLERIGEQLRALGHDGASHTFISQLNEEIEGVTTWQGRRQRVLEHWRDQQYLKAWAEFEGTTTAEEKAFEWVEDNTRTSWRAWRDFGEIARNGIESWRQHDYENAPKWLGTAATRVPSDIEPELKTRLETYFSKLAEDLKALQTKLSQAQNLLWRQDATYYEPVSEALKTAQEIEKKYYQADEAEAAHVKRIADRYETFKRYALVGDVKQLGSVFQASISDGDPLSEAYERIRNTINLARQPKATQQQVLDALELAPQATELVKRREQLERKRKKITRMLIIAATTVIGITTVLCLAYFVYLNNSPSSFAAVLNLTPTETPSPMPSPTPIVIKIRVTATPIPPTMTPTNTHTPEPTATPTSSPIPTPTNALELITTPTSSSALALSPTPTPTLRPTVALARTGSFQNLFDGDLGTWDTEIGFNRNRPSLYRNRTFQWNIWTADSPHEFWLQQPIQGPVDFMVSLNAIRPDSRYGLLIKEEERGERFGFYVHQVANGRWEFEIRRESEVMATGPSSSYSQTDAPFNNLTIKLTDQLISFIINNTEEVYIYQPPDNFNGRWQLGLGADANAHAIIGSARVYELVPAR